MNKQEQKTLSHHMPWPEKIIVDQEAASTPLARKVIRKLPGVPVKTIAPGEDISGCSKQDKTLAIYLKHYRGRFLRPCPATRQYRCCGYQIIHIGENCPLNCSYCILQAYFQDRILKVWANQEDLRAELDRDIRPEQEQAVQNRHRRIHRLSGPGIPDRLLCRSRGISWKLSQCLPGTQIKNH
jgi:hypothetical protein